MNEYREDKTRKEFEAWLRETMVISTERYTSFPFTYKMIEVENMFTGWIGAKKRYIKS